MGQRTVTLLVVDDNPEFCELLKEMLALEGVCRIIGEAYDGASALRLVEELQPEAVLLDVEMPGMHGLQVAGRIRSQHPGVKVVLMSAYHEREYREQALLAGAIEFIPKVELSIERLRHLCEQLASM